MNAEDQRQNRQRNVVSITQMAERVDASPADHDPAHQVGLRRKTHSSSGADAIRDCTLTGSSTARLVRSPTDTGFGAAGAGEPGRRHSGETSLQDAAAGLPNTAVP